MTQALEFKLHGEVIRVVPKFAKYITNKHTSLQFLDAENGLPYVDATVNIPEANVPDNDYIVVKDYGENKGIADELIRHGFIQSIPTGYVNSRYVSVPMYKLTQKAILIRDKHFNDLGV